MNCKLRTSSDQPIAVKYTLLVTAITLGSFVFTTVTEAVSPAPDGGYAGFNTAEGQNALFSLSSGVWNTALGGYSLFSDTSGSSNTAVGVDALFSNTNGFDNTANGVQALFKNTSG